MTHPPKCTRGPDRSFARLPLRWLAALLLGCLQSAGCMSHVARISSASNAIPVERVPPEILTPPRSATVPIDFTLLRQQPAPVHYVDAGDTLAVYIEGVTVFRRDEAEVDANAKQDQMARPRRSFRCGARPTLTRPRGSYARRPSGCPSASTIAASSCSPWSARAGCKGYRWTRRRKRFVAPIPSKTRFSP